MPSPELGVGNEAARVYHTGRNYRIPARLCRPGAGHSKIRNNCQLKGRQPLKSKGTTPLVGGWNSTRKPSGARHQTRGVSLRFWISQERQGVVSWFEFIDFRCDIVVGSLFGGH